jgi:hypothetical protein
MMPDLATIIDAGSFGLLVLIVFMIGQKIDRMIDVTEKLMAQLIEIIGRDAVKKMDGEYYSWPESKS